MRENRRKLNSACAQDRQNVLIIFGLFVVVTALLFRPYKAEETREVYLLLGMIIGSLTTFLNHSTQEAGQGGVSTGTVENLTMTPPMTNEGTQELPPLQEEETKP